MKTRIWYQSMTPLASLANYHEALQDCARKVCSEGVEVFFNGMSAQRYEGRTPADILKYPYAKLMFQQEAIDFSRRAERDGFDAVVLGSFSEPFLPEIRSLLDIPVVSLAEASLLVACSLAEQFALVSLAPPNVKRLRSLVRRHGMESRVSGIYALAAPLDEGLLETAFKKPKAVADDFVATARKAIEAGADVVIPAEGLLNLLVHASGVSVVDQATILDSVATSLLYAELMVKLRRRAGTGVGRRWAYAKPADDLLAVIDTIR